MTYDDQDDLSWLDAMVSEVPVAPVHTVKPKTASKGLWKMTPEVGAKISAALKGKKRTAHTAQTRAKISAAIKGRTHTTQTRAQMSATRKGKGRTHTAQTRAKIQANSSQSKPIMTPTGAFPSKYAAGAWAQAHGLADAHNKINKWLKTHPDQFYYIPKETK